MALQNFIDLQPPVVSAAWLNRVDISLKPQHAVYEAGITIVHEGANYGDPYRYGGDPTGVAASDAAFAAALLQNSRGGWPVVFQGVYKIATGVKMIADGCSIFGAGPVSQLKGSAININVLKIAASNCTVDNFTINGNSLAGVTGLALTPLDEASTTVLAYQNENTISRLLIKNCVEGTRLRVGPRTGSPIADSQCFYNVFINVNWVDCVRALWQQNGATAVSSGPNGSNYFGCRIGSATANLCNTGIQIDSGAQPKFFGCAVEGMTGTASSPNAVCTAVKIAQSNSGGADNNEVEFYGCRLEACTRQLDNASLSLCLFGGTWDASLWGGGGVAPKFALGGEPSVMPIIVPGLQYGEGVTGFPSGYWGMGKEVADAGYPWANYALSAGIMSNVTAISGAVSKFTKRGHLAKWTASFTLQAAVGATRIEITPPAAIDPAFIALVTLNGFGVMSVNNGAAKEFVECGFVTTTGKFYILAPVGLWNIAGLNNQVFINIEYPTV